MSYNYVASPSDYGPQQWEQPAPFGTGVRPDSAQGQSIRYATIPQPASIDTWNQPQIFEAPTIAGSVTASPGTGLLTLTGFAPTILTPRVVLPGTGILTLTGFAPKAVIGIVVKPGVGALTLTGFVPLVLTPVAVLPGVGILVLSGFAPTVTIGGGAVAAALYFRYDP